MDDNDKRLYQRGEHFHSAAKVSRDNRVWKSVEINDLSSGGMSVIAKEKYNVGEKLFFDLEIQGFFSQFEIECEGIIKNERHTHDNQIYGVVFTGLSPDKKILIDENIKKDRPVGGNPYSVDSPPM